MEQSKFSLADVLTVVATLVFGFGCFLSINFMSIGKDEVWGMPHTTGVIMQAVAIALLFFSFAFGAKLLKRTKKNHKISIIFEYIFVMIFVLLAIVFTTVAPYFTHYFTVYSQRTTIKNKLNNSILRSKDMFVEYEKYAEKRESLYKEKLNAVVKAKRVNPADYNSYGFGSSDGVSDADQIKTKLFTIHADLFPSNYSDSTQHNGIKEVAIHWLDEAEMTISSWKPIGVVGVVNHIETNTNKWLTILHKLSEVREQGENAKDFDYDLQFDDVKTNFTEIKSPSALAIGLSVLVYVLMILSWVVSKRGPGFPGYKILFGIGENQYNEYK